MLSLFMAPLKWRRETPLKLFVDSFPAIHEIKPTYHFIFRRKNIFFTFLNRFSEKESSFNFSLAYK